MNRHCQTILIESFCIDVYPFSFPNRVRNGANVTVGLGSSFATSFPVTLCSTFPVGMVSDVSVTYLSMPFTIRTQEAFSVSEQRFDLNFETVTFLMKADLYIQDWTDLHVSTDPLSLGVLLHFEVTCTLDIDFAFHLVLLLQQV